MPDVLIVKNISREGPGILAQLLRQHQITHDLINLEDEPFPDPVNYKAVIVLGGPDSANDNNPKISQEITQVKSVLNANIPYLGICLGMQILVKAAGGRVLASPVKESGLRDPDGKLSVVNLTQLGQEDKLLQDVPNPAPVFHLHGETVELLDDMKLLATGEFCRNQIVKVADNVYGIQSHFELTDDMLRVWADEDPDLVPIGKRNLLKDFQAVELAYTEVGRVIFTNFLKLAKVLS